MKLTVLDSGSRANGYVLQNEEEALIIECGCSLQSCLEVLDYRSGKVAGCLVSHSHGDHCKYVKSYLERFKVFCSEGTAEEASIIGGVGLIIVAPMRKFSAGGFEILPFETQHDAKEPLGFLIRHDGLGTLLFATDTYYLKYKFDDLNHILIECNYDECILSENIANGEVPRFVLERVRRSHMSLDTLKDTLRANDLSGVVDIVLLHISRDNGDMVRFREEIERTFGIRTFIASKGLEIELYKDKLI
ncbi:MAG: MBL fold metallo-hydrolase [Bacteroidales bacterium]|nr:MBL fold metallo-hydrolase [Bacteroidales bacterium]